MGDGWSHVYTTLDRIGSGYNRTQYTPHDTQPLFQHKNVCAGKEVGHFPKHSHLDSKEEDYVEVGCLEMESERQQLWSMRKMR